jgi:hypothetical protein
MGASRRRADVEPSAKRVDGPEARLEALGHQVTDGGNIRVEVEEGPLIDGYAKTGKNSLPVPGYPS